MPGSVGLAPPLSDFSSFRGRCIASRLSLKESRTSVHTAIDFQHHFIDHVSFNSSTLADTFRRFVPARFNHPPLLHITRRTAPAPHSLLGSDGGDLLRRRGDNLRLGVPYRGCGPRLWALAQQQTAVGVSSFSVLDHQLLTHGVPNCHDRVCASNPALSIISDKNSKSVLNLRAEYRLR